MSASAINQADEGKIVELRRQIEAKVEEERQLYENEFEEETELSSLDILEGLRANEDGDGQLFSYLNRDRFSYDHKRGLWHMWKGHYWSEDEINNSLAAVETVVDVYAEEAERQAQTKINETKAGNNESAKKAEHLEKELLQRIQILQTVRRKKNVLILASSGDQSLGISGDQWDADPFLLGCKNAVIDLRTGTARPGRPSDYIKTVAPTEWQGLEAQATVFDQFVNEILDGNVELAEFVQRLLGVAISGLSIEHVFPICWGKGRNGKGTLFESLKEVLGEVAGPIQSEMLLKQTFTRSSAGPSPDIMSLQGKRLVWASEIEEGRLLNVAKVKWLVGGDTLVGRPVQGRKEIRFKPSHTLFMLTNHKPHIPSDDPAIWQRVFLIEFGLSFVDAPQRRNERKCDPHMKNKLLSESPGVLAWLVRGFMEYFNHGLNPPDCVRVATAKYRNAEDVIGQFIDECCLLASTYKEQANPLYQAYRKWCEFNGYLPLGSRKFGEKMRERFKRVVETKGRFYKGIKLNIVVT